MAFLNYFLQFKTFADKNPSNSPNLTNMNWVRDVQGISVENQSSQVVTVAPEGVVSLFDSEEASKKLLYIEADGELQIAINNGDPITIKPLVLGLSKIPASYLLVGLSSKIVITNPSTDTEVSIFAASVE